MPWSGPVAERSMPGIVPRRSSRKPIHNTGRLPRMLFNHSIIAIFTDDEEPLQ